jgi:hypothetical protein
MANGHPKGPPLGGTPSSSCISDALVGVSERLVQIYDLYRDVYLSRTYYARKLNDFQLKNTISEILVALGAGSVGGLAIFHSTAGMAILPYLAAISAILSIVKPTLQWPKQIALISKLLAGYTDLYFDLKQIVQEVAVQRGLTKQQNLRCEQAEQRFKKLALEEPPHSARLKEQCRAEVLKAIPVETLWVPERPGTFNQPDGGNKSS